MQLITLLWWPHSGGRWLSRSIIGNNSQVEQTTFVHPWIFNSSDDTLAMDITAQVHKARSLPELSGNLEALKLSTDYGRIEGLKKYYSLMARNSKSNKKVLFGESCLGSPTPKSADLHAIFSAWPTMKIIHLVRNPLDSFASFKSRHEMEGDPVKIAGSWVTLNAMIREYFNNEGKRFDDKYLSVKYEDLLKSPEEEVKRISRFCDLDFEDSMLTLIQERWGKKTEIEIDSKCESLIKSIASSEMKIYGYL